jgi:hypothetical protein
MKLLGRKLVVFGLILAGVATGFSLGETTVAKEISRKAKTQASRRVGQRLAAIDPVAFQEKLKEVEAGEIILNREEKRLLKRKARGKKN